MVSPTLVLPASDLFPEVRVHTLPLGPMDNLIYLIEDPASGHAAVIDPAWDADEIMQSIEQRGLRLTDVLITHGHDDHVNRLGHLLSEYAAAVHVTAQEVRYWRRATSGSAHVGRPADRRREIWAAAPPMRLETHVGDEQIELGRLRIQVIATPGHSPGGACYLIGDHLFTGDTLFLYGCGRCDLAGSDPRQMFDSLRSLIERVPGEVVVHPGHRYAPQMTSNMAEQRRGNPFLHIETQDAFVAFRAEHNRHRLPPYTPVPRGSRAW